MGGGKIYSAHHSPSESLLHDLIRGIIKQLLPWAQALGRIHQGAAGRGGGLLAVAGLAPLSLQLGTYFSLTLAWPSWMPQHALCLHSPNPEQNQASLTARTLRVAPYHLELWAGVE